MLLCVCVCVCVLLVILYGPVPGLKPYKGIQFGEYTQAARHALIRVYWSTTHAVHGTTCRVLLLMSTMIYMLGTRSNEKHNTDHIIYNNLCTCFLLIVSVYE